MPWQLPPRRGILLAALLVTAARAHAGDAGLAERIDLALSRGGLRGARVGLLVADLATGATLYEHSADDLMVPASLTKIVTSATALDVLTPQYRFETAIYGVGRRTGRGWRGDVYLRACGDPELVGERVWAMVDDLRRKGIYSLDGTVVVDDSYFDQERFGTDWGAISRSWYKAPHGAVSVNFNTLPTRGGRSIAIAEDPSLNAGRFLVGLMTREGIEVRGPVRVGGTVPRDAVLLASSTSEPLREIVAQLNKVSHNFIAEQLLKTLGAEAEGPPGTAAKGLAVVGSYLRRLGVPGDGFVLKDGSGLSRSNRLTARTLVRVLRAVANDFEIGPEFVASLKVSGAEGKDGRFRDGLCRRRMRIKTGHLYGVAGLAGVAETLGGQRLAFAILVNDYRRGRRAADRGLEDVCEVFLGLGAPGGTPPAVEGLVATAPPPLEEPPRPGPEAADEEEEGGDLDQED